MRKYKVKNICIALAGLAVVSALSVKGITSLTQSVKAVEAEEPILSCQNLQTPYIEMSNSDIRELACLVYLEGRGESYECQKAIASVVINRMVIGHKTLQEVIYAKGQFEPADMISYTEPNTSCYNAVLQVVNEGPSIPRYVTFFRADHYFDWGDRYVDYMNIDNTYFSYDTHLYNHYIGM